MACGRVGVGMAAGGVGVAAGVGAGGLQAGLEEGLAARHLAAGTPQQDAAGLEVSCLRDRYRHAWELLLQLPESTD